MKQVPDRREHGIDRVVGKQQFTMHGCRAIAKRVRPILEN